MAKDKPKRSFWTSILWAGGIIVVSSMIAIWITGYTYIYKTLIYTYPGIDDISIFDTRIVNDSGPQPWPQSSQYNKIKLTADLDDELQRNESVAFLVIKNDSVAYEQYWDHYSDNTLSNSFSMAKSIVGILTGIAIGDGLISIDDPVGKYIPEFNDSANSKLKIRHLLMMSSGLNWDESYNSLFSQTTEAYYGTDLKELVTHLKVVEEPGKTFRYMSCNTVLLAMIISKVSGMTLSEYAEKKLWKKIGATQPAYWSLDHNEGLEKSYCCFYSNAGDFARIGKLYMDNGRWNGKMIVPSDYVQASITPNGCIDESGMAIDYYGYQWWLMNYENHKIFYARGILGQYIIVIPDERIIIVRLGKLRGEKTKTNHYSDMVLYTADVLKIFGSKTVE
jgi:CubicO group peptidase (beta-lactamase class C family)